MKKNLKLNIIGTLLLLIITSCNKEILFQEGFEHRINHLDNSEIFLNTLKTLQLEVYNISGKNQQNSTYHVSFEKVSGDLDLIFDENQTLIEGEYYELKNFNGKKDFQIKPKTLGSIQLKILVKDSNNIIKSRRIELFTTDQDYDFNFTVTPSNATPEIGEIVNLSIEVFNLGLSQDDTYQIKYVDNLPGELSLEGTVLEKNKYVPIQKGRNVATYSISASGEQQIIFTVINSKNMEKEITVLLEYAKDNSFLFELPIKEVSIKETLSIPFTGRIQNTNVNFTYKMKLNISNFQGSSPDYINITYNGTSFPLNTESWTDFEIPTDGILNFTATSDKPGLVWVNIYIMDSYNQTENVTLKLTITPRPIISSLESTKVFISPNYHKGYRINEIKYDNAAIVTYELKIKNINTGIYDTFNQKQAVIMITPNNRGGAYTRMPYTVRVQDSDGVWSLTYSGTFDDI